MRLVYITLARKILCYGSFPAKVLLGTNAYNSQINNPHIFVGRLNNEYKKKITMGGVIPYVDIINRLKLGYYKYKTPGWKIENGKNVPIIE